MNKKWFLATIAAASLIFSGIAFSKDDEGDVDGKDTTYLRVTISTYKGYESPPQNLGQGIGNLYDDVSIEGFEINNIDLKSKKTIHDFNAHLSDLRDGSYAIGWHFKAMVRHDDKVQMHKEIFRKDKFSLKKGESKQMVIYVDEAEKFGLYKKAVITFELI